MGFQTYKTNSADSARRTQMAAALAPQSSQGGAMPDDIKALMAQYQSGQTNGIPNALLQYAQAHPEAGIDRSGYNYQQGSGEYKFYNPSAGQTPGQNWWFADDRNLPAGGFSGQTPSSTAGSPYTPETNSPEANNAINHQQPSAKSYNRGEQTPSPEAPTGQPTAQPAPQVQAPLQLQGKSNQDQAKILSDYLRSQGVEVGKMVVGGNSPYDQQIITLINQINDPNTTDAQRKLAAQQIGGLINQRNSSASGDVSQYDPMTGTYLPVGAAGTTTGGGGSTGGQQQTPSLSTTPAMRAMLERLLGEFSGGTPEAAAQQRRTQEAAYIQDAENSGLAKRKALAERLTALGMQGGIGSDKLTEAEGQINAQRDSGLANLDAAIMGQQQQSKAQALSTMLQMQGYDTQTANNMAGLNVQRELGLGNIALGQRGQDINLGLANNSQQMGFLTHLIDLAWSGDQNAQAQVDAYIKQLIMGGE